jgi:hypothetical protein
MKPRSKSPAKTRRPARRLEVLALGLLLLAGTAPDARACGPYFPNRYLDATTERLLSAPEAYFADELWRLTPAGTPRPTEGEPRYPWDRERLAEATARRSAETDIAELEAVLRAAGTDAAEAKRLAEAYRAARAEGAEAPAGTPREFALYLRGAQAWKRDETDAARAAWQDLLDLPEAERRHRSVWAAYMLGRSRLDLWRKSEAMALDDAETSPDAAAEARRWFLLAEERAAKGDTDLLGLAGEAKGWRARLAAERRDYPEATALYLDRLAAGDDTAVQSLRRVARRIMNEAWGDDLARHAADERTRGLVVAHLLSRGLPEHDWHDADSRRVREARSWAIAIRTSGVAEVRGADRLAWLAYEGGLFGLAAEWLALAPAESREADWLRAKLALRRGDLAEGARWLERALDGDGLANGHRDQAWAELGRVKLSQDLPTEALRAFFHGGHWEDGAYVAEQVLTTDELIQVARELAPAPPPVRDERAVFHDPRVALRGLLARRLAREGRHEDALRFFPPETGAAYASHVADVRAGFDSTRPAAERAEALWRAARALRTHGMEWIGTELEPDWGIWGGTFETLPAAEARGGMPRWEGGALAPTDAELARIGSRPTVGPRFHYRYEAAQLAWWAASLMPDQSDATARVLIEAGGWLKARDPKAAEPFYQALVLRCGRTALGREAARRRWFPDEG